MDALNKVLDAQPEADFKSEELDIKKILECGERHKTHTTHYKMTQTKVTEVERTESSDDELTEQEQMSAEKKKHRGCFGSCFKKKAK